MSDASAAGQSLRVEQVRPHVALVMLDRPQVMNAIDSKLAVAIEAAVRALDADAEVRVVVLTGAGGRAFCAGADMKEIAADPASSRRTAAGGFAGFVDLPRAKPWIAAVNGAALGGGFEIALACDLIVASDTARFGLPEVKRANLALGGGLRRLPRALPRAIAIEMILTRSPPTRRSRWPRASPSRGSRPNARRRISSRSKRPLTRPTAARRIIRKARAPSSSGAHRAGRGDNA